MEEGEVLHRALEAAFEVFLPAFDTRSVYERRRGHLFLACPRLAFPQFNGVWIDGAGEVDVEELRDERARVRALGVPFWMQTRNPGEAERRIAAELELLPSGETPGMIVRPDELGEAVAHEVEIQRVEREADLREAQGVAAAGFGVPPELFAPMYTPAVLDTSGISFFLARAADGEPVSTVVSFVGGDAAGVFNVATPPPFRRRGLGAAVTRHACVDAFERGARVAWLQGSEEGEGVYRRLGFRTVVRYGLFAESS